MSFTGEKYIEVLNEEREQGRLKMVDYEVLNTKKKEKLWYEKAFSDGFDSVKELEKLIQDKIKKLEQDNKWILGRIKENEEYIQQNIEKAEKLKIILKELKS